MKGWLIAIVLAGLVVSAAPPARAQSRAPHPLATSAPWRCGADRCTGVFYRSDDLEFGQYLIGETTRVCEGDCEFVAGGVHYAVVQNRIDAMRIEVGAETPLPFGLRGDETPDAALAAMARVTSVPMEISGREDGDRVVTVQGSLKNARGRPEWFNMVFSPENRLYLIEMYGPR
jgi:hypothetical protein